MNRLTEKIDLTNAKYILKNEHTDTEAVERLGAYEDTGMTPEDVVRINNFANSQLAKTIAKLQAYERTGLTPEEIMDGKMLTGWIPVEEQLPRETRNEYGDPVEYIVMIDGARMPTVLYYYGNDIWLDDKGTFYDVVAWMPLPEPYKTNDC